MRFEYVEARQGSYADSVTLMQISQLTGGAPGVQAALIAMATELNLDLLSGMGFPPTADAGPNDLLIALRAESDEALQQARVVVDTALTARPPRGGVGGTDEQSPRTTTSAIRRGAATLALVSVPGRYAFVECMDALEAGCDVMLFSDNVALEQEIRLKDEAAARGLLVMGPDCGTAVVGGVGLGFANVVRPGPIGLVAASGTGAQQVLCLLDIAGVGISACLGVGGRDLSSPVRARSTLRSLDILDADPATELIIVVSKPPAAEVADAVRAHAATLTTPVHFALLGQGQPDLTAAAEIALTMIGSPIPRWPRWPAEPTVEPAVEPRSGALRGGALRGGALRGGALRGGALRGGALRGLFAGGTLCDEAMIIAAARLGPIRSNIPLHPDWALPRGSVATGHVMIDFGDDALTAGRPHPMIDQSLRIDRLAAEAADPTCTVVLLDVVLGHGAHADPAAELAPAIEAARSTATTSGRDLTVVVSLVGSTGDPQGLHRQAAALHGAGARVSVSNAEAARQAVALVGDDR